MWSTRADLREGKVMRWPRAYVALWLVTFVATDDLAQQMHTYVDAWKTPSAARCGELPHCDWMADFGPIDVGCVRGAASRGFKTRR